MFYAKSTCMSLIRSPIFQLFMNRMMENFDDVIIPTGYNNYLYTTEDGYALEIPIPGMTKENVKIQLDEQNTMHIKAQTDQKNKYKQMSSNYEYVQSIPKDADLETLEASVENGILTIQMKKIKKTRNVKEIMIR
jgi:HSP20 family molecular chaperone IbpA